MMASGASYAGQSAGVATAGSPLDETKAMTAAVAGLWDKEVMTAGIAAGHGHFPRVDGVDVSGFYRLSGHGSRRAAAVSG
jgi:hypothetical protein